MRPSLRSASVLCLLVAAAAGLVAHMRVFAFVTDDAFISFVYSRNLVEHGQLVFNLGERVEGYTNFLWTVFLAGWMKLGWQPESSSIVWGTAFAIATMFVGAWLLKSLRVEGEREEARAGAAVDEGWSPWDAVPALFLAVVPGYACWAGGGLETQMFTFFVTLASALYLVPPRAAPTRLRYSAALVFGLAALTRPEGNLLFALAMLHRSILWLRQKRLPRRDELFFVGLFVLVVGPHFLWRHAYYGYWLPNTFYIKASGAPGTWAHGLYYLRRYFGAFLLPLFLIPPLVARLMPRPAATTRFLDYVGVVLPAFWLYVASVGGDFMGLFRFALPVVPLVLVASVEGRRQLASFGRSGSALRPVLAVGVVLSLYVWNAVKVDRAALVAAGPSDNGIDRPGYLRWYTADRAAIGKWFAQVRQPDDFASVGGAGAQVYYSRIPSLDCFGLSDAHIAHDVPANNSRPGHQKYAPIEYELERKPTIITSRFYNIGSAPYVGSDAPFWRQHGFHYVSVRIPGLSSPWYSFLKRVDRRVGPLAAIDGEID